MLTTNSTEAMDLSDLFPEAPAEKTTTLFTKDSETIDMDKAMEETPANLPLAENKMVVSKVNLDTLDTVPQGTLSVESLLQNTEDFEEAKQGSKSDLISFFKEKITSGELTAFDDFDESKQTIDQYLKTFKTKDFDELWKSNVKQKENDFAQKIPQQFFESLPPELQAAARYHNDGGTDMKSMFRALAQVEEIKALDPEKDARKVCENYLLTKEFGSDEEIKEQLDEWEDLGIMAKKSKGFKPQLEKMEDVLIQKKLQQQESIKNHQAAEAEFYHNSVQEALRTEDLGGIRLDKKTQIELYRGLTDASFQDRQGNRCNEFHHLLDKIMWQEPDYKKLAKIHWILKDEAGYEKALSNKAINIHAEESFRTLKTEQAKNRFTQAESPEPKTTLIPRGSRMFKR